MRYFGTKFTIFYKILQREILWMKGCRSATPSFRPNWRRQRKKKENHFFPHSRSNQFFCRAIFFLIWWRRKKFKVKKVGYDFFPSRRQNKKNRCFRNLEVFWLMSNDLLSLLVQTNWLRRCWRKKYLNMIFNGECKLFLRHKNE